MPENSSPHIYPISVSNYDFQLIVTCLVLDLWIFILCPICYSWQNHVLYFFPDKAISTPTSSEEETRRINKYKRTPRKISLCKQLSILCRVRLIRCVPEIDQYFKSQRVENQTAMSLCLHRKENFNDQRGDFSWQLIALIEYSTNGDIHLISSEILTSEDRCFRWWIYLTSESVELICRLSIETKKTHRDTEENRIISCLFFAMKSHTKESIFFRDLLIRSILEKFRTRTKKKNSLIRLR